MGTHQKGNMNLFTKLDRWTDRHPWKGLAVAALLLSIALWMTYQFDSGLSEATLFVIRGVIVSLMGLSVADTLFRRIL